MRIFNTIILIFTILLCVSSVNATFFQTNLTNSIDNKAFSSQDYAGIADPPTFAAPWTGVTEANTEQYQNMSNTSDNKYARVLSSAGNKEPGWTFNFTLNKSLYLDEGRITSLYIEIRGYDDATETPKCYVANWTGSTWNTGVSNFNFTSNITDARTLRQLINDADGKVSVVCIGIDFDNAGDDELWIDFAQVQIQYTPITYPGIVITLPFQTTALNPQGNKIVREGDDLSFAYADTNNDLRIYNTSNNGSWWDASTRMRAGTAEDVNYLEDGNQKRLLLWSDSSGTTATQGIQVLNRSASTVFISNDVVVPQWVDNGTSANFATPNDLDMVVSPNNVFHTCIIAAAFNDSNSNDWLLYSNWTPDQGWWTDTSVRNQHKTYNGTWINTSLGSNHCAIVADNDSNVYVIWRQSTNNNMYIVSNRGGWTNSYLLNSTFNYINMKAQYDYINNKIGLFTGKNNNNGNWFFLLNETKYWNVTLAWTVINATTETQSSEQTNPWLGFSFNQNWYAFDSNNTPSTARSATRYNSSNSTTPFWSKTFKYYEDPGSLGSGGNNWSSQPSPTCMGSAYPTWMRINGTLECLYFNRTSNTIYYDRINVNFTPPPTIDKNMTTVNYTNIAFVQGNYTPIYEVNVSINISYYNNSGSTAQNSLNNTLRIGAWNGTNQDNVILNITGVGRYNVSFRNSDLLTTWANNQNDRNLTIEFIYFDSGGDNITYDYLNVSIVAMDKWTNSSLISFRGTNNVSNYSLSINSASVTVNWCFFANETGGFGYNSCNPYSSYITTTPVVPGGGDTCNISGTVTENRYVSCSDNCVFRNNTNFKKFNATIYGTTGSVTWLANWTNFTQLYKEAAPNCPAYIVPTNYLTSNDG